VSEPVRLDRPPGLAAVVALVVEPQALVVAAHGRECGEHLGVDAGLVPGDLDGCLVQRGDPVPQPRREDLLELGERPDRRLLDPGDGVRGPQPHRDGDGFLVVEQERRHGGTGAEAVATRDTRCGVHGVAQVAEPFDVVADGPGGDAELLGQRRPRPVTAGLQQ
jgi:hypothetical protein